MTIKNVMLNDGVKIPIYGFGHFRRGIQEVS